MEALALIDVRRVPRGGQDHDGRIVEGGCELLGLGDGQDPVAFVRRFRDKIAHCHIKDVSEELARAVRGGETGIACSVVAIGEGVNAENIAGCIELLRDADWDGVLSIECEAAPGKVEQSLEWLRTEIAR